ncbi:transposase [Penicillium taxi]|uniref:transposase n=1 Tax=Penicillium taxi TaxID=168475 RepID=UPI00254504A9|nr:transposase [Penicillium taxi]KAJ5895126.1 transposase [Penicillium taxi]
MSQIEESTESRLSKAHEAAKREETPNISKIARDYGVSRHTLSNRLKKGATARSQRNPANKALDNVQEEALVRWIDQLHNWNMPPTPKLIQAWANRSLRGASHVGLSWVYRFIKRLPEELQLALKKQYTKESKRIQAEDPAELGVPSRLIYNFDQFGFRPGEGKIQVASRKKKAYPDLETEGGENVTAVECIAADGWPSFDEDLPPNMMIKTSPNGWISDEIALQWLDSFIKATDTPDRLKKGETRVLIFDGRDSHLTLEFLQKCEDYKIIPFGFLPYSTHLCQPLNGKPFFSYKQHLRLLNDDISYWSGASMTKAEFLRETHPVRQKAFNPQIIRDSFEERGIYPMDSNKVLSKLPNQRDMISRNLIITEGGLTELPEDPAPSPSTSSSSIEHTPPTTMAMLQENQEMLLENIDLLTPKLQRWLTRLCNLSRLFHKELLLFKDIVEHIMDAQESLRHSKTKQ